MDLNELKPQERVVEILSPGTKQEIGIRVTLLHISDDRLVKLRRKFLDERYRLEAKGKTMKSEIYESNLNELAFTAMTGWEWYGDITMDGKKPDFTRPNVMQVFEKHPWFRDQIGEEVSDSEAFFTI